MKSQHFDVTLISNLSEGIEMLKYNKYIVVLLDIWNKTENIIPKLNEFSCWEGVHRQKPQKIIGMSSDPVSDSDKCLFDDFIIKSNLIEDLIQKMKHVNQIKFVYPNKTKEVKRCIIC